MSASQIHQLIRAAAAHEDAAGRHEDKYEQQMKSAGASMYEAFVLALRAAPEYQGRQIDDKAILRIYQSTKPRPWWDEHLKAVGLLAAPGRADRERATRMIQWHVDVNAAKGRRAEHALRLVAQRKKEARQGVGKTHGAREHHKPSQAREAVHAAKVTAAAHDAAVGHRGLDADLKQMMDVPLDDLMREASRISSGVKKVRVEYRGTVRDILITAAREVEEYTT